MWFYMYEHLAKSLDAKSKHNTDFIIIKSAINYNYIMYYKLIVYVTNC